MLAWLLVIGVAAGNFVLGFLLAAHLGHGPAWAELPSANKLRAFLQALLHRRAKPAASPPAH